MTTKEIRVGDIYEDCAYHPVLCTEICGDDVAGKSLIDGSEPRSCSLRYCNVKKLTQEEADLKIEAFLKDGERGLMRLAGMTDLEIDKFMKAWR